MIVKDIMSKNVITLGPNDTIQKLISLMEKNHIHEVPIVDKKKLVGIVQTKKLTQKSILDPYKTKVKSIKMSAPAVLSPDQDMDEAAKLLLKTGLRGLPVVDKKELVGILSIHDIIDEVAKTKLFRQTKAEKIMSKIVTVTDDTDIGKARVLMREQNISKIPIVDSKGKLKGIVTAFDMLKSIKTRERMDFFSMAAEMDRIMQIPVTTIMNKKPITSNPGDSLTDIALTMNKYKRSGIIITDKDFPVGVIVLKDLLEFYISGLEKKGVYYQIVGLGDEDSFITDTVERMINETIQKVSSIYKILSLFLHVKKHNVGLKGKTKYSIRVRLRTDKDLYITKAWAWDLRMAVDQALDQIERTVFKDKKVIKDRVKWNARLMKQTQRR